MRAGRLWSVCGCGGSVGGDGSGGRGAGVVVGGVVVAPKASELIYPITVAVQNHLTVDDIAASFTVYPSLTGSIAEAARQLHPTT